MVNGIHPSHTTGIGTGFDRRPQTPGHIQQAQQQAGGVAIRPDPQQLTLNAALEKINEKLESMGLRTTSALAPDEFTAEKVSERILGFVSRGLENAKASGASDEEVASLFEAAKSGFEQGFNEAKDILKELDALTPKVEEDIGQTYDLVHKGFDKLAETLPGYVPPPQEQSEGEKSSQASNTTSSAELSASKTSAPQNVRYAESASYAREDVFSLDIQTNDGDIVTLYFDNTQAEGYQERYRHNPGQSSYQLDAFSLSSSNLSLSVQGNLDEDELASINELVGNIGGVAEDFFAGDIEGAFNKALELGLDTSELASFSLDLTTTETYQYAAAYQANAPQTPASGSPVNHLLDYVKSIQEQVEQTREKLSSVNPESFTRDLLDTLFTHHPQFTEKAEEEQQQSRNTLQELLDIAIPQQEQQTPDSV